MPLLLALLQHHDLHDTNTGDGTRVSISRETVHRIARVGPYSQQVDGIEDQTDTLSNWIARDSAALSQVGVRKDLLRVVEQEAREQGYAAICRAVLEERHCAHRHARQDHRGQTSGQENSESAHEGASEVHELLRLSGGANVGQSSDGSCGVESSARENSRVKVEHGREDRSLSS